MTTEILSKVSPEEVPDIQSIAPDTEKGYILEVDLEALMHLHNYFADYPLVPKKQIIPKNWISLYNEMLVHNKNVGERKYVSGKKLVTKILSTLKFRQFPRMKEYIEENIRKRKIAKANGDEFGVMYYKLKNNAVFSKQTENVHKHIRDETKGISIGEMVCLRPKMYLVLPAEHDSKTPDDPDFENPKKKHRIQKAKGVKKYVVKR
ncbi:zinc finger protein [Gigaspora margarita]|uniref:Zinc finger protein n=1 Tax=Gigaspora margarita TaxID=4874 RepID=A0A8H3XC13_GIGMA|nr:zinc finger protein [Gigaspora margarita]